MLHNLDVGLNDMVHLVFAELKDPARHKIDRELTRTIDSSHFFSTLEAAIGGVPGRVGCGLVSGHPEDRT